MVALPPSTGPIEGRVDAAAINGVDWGAWLALTTILSHFPELESDFKLLGSRYDADLMKDEMEIFYTQTHRPSGSLSWRVPPLATRSQPNDVGEK
jgi:hypothetical protein